MIPLLSEAVIKNITQNLKIHRPYIFTVYDSTPLMYQILKRKNINKIRKNSTNLTGESHNKKLLEQVLEEASLYFNEILPLEVLVELRTDPQDYVYIYIKNKKLRYGKFVETWGKSSSDELGLVTNSRMKTIFEFKNTIISLKSIDKMLNKIHKSFCEGEFVRHDHKNKHQYYDDNMLLLTNYLGSVWGGKVILRPTEYLTNYPEENICLILEFEPDKELDGLYKLYKKGGLGNVS